MAENIVLEAPIGEETRKFEFRPMTREDAVVWGSGLSAISARKQALEKALELAKKMPVLDQNDDEIIVIEQRIATLDVRMLKSFKELSKFVVSPAAAEFAKLSETHPVDATKVLDLFLKRCFPTEEDSKK